MIATVLTPLRPQGKLYITECMWCTHLQTYLLTISSKNTTIGKQFTTLSDCKPLQPIFEESHLVDQINYKDGYWPYDYKISYRPGRDLANGDMLSRLLITESPQNVPWNHSSLKSLNFTITTNNCKSHEQVDWSTPCECLPSIQYKISWGSWGCCEIMQWMPANSSWPATCLTTPLIGNGLALLGHICIYRLCWTSRCNWCILYIFNLQLLIHLLLQLPLSLFATHSISESTVSENAIVLLEKIFRNLWQWIGIHHIRSASYHPATNSLAEQAVQTLNYYPWGKQLLIPYKQEFLILFSPTTSLRTLLLGLNCNG